MGQNKVRGFGVILDAPLSMEAEVTANARSASYYLRLVRQLVSYLDTARVINTTITSRLDYYNST